MTQETAEARPSPEYQKSFQKFRDFLGDETSKSIERDNERLSVSADSPDRFDLSHSTWGKLNDQEIRLTITYRLSPNGPWLVGLHTVSPFFPFPAADAITITRGNIDYLPTKSIIEAKINGLVAKFIDQPHEDGATS